MAEEQNMARVRVSRQVLIMPQPDTTVLYPAGFEGTAPHAHIDHIVAAGAGERVGGQQQPQKVAENQDAFKSGSDNVSIG
jgi:hypothetical protein